jgi:hypothetical protein
MIQVTAKAMAAKAAKPKKMIAEYRGAWYERMTDTIDQRKPITAPIMPAGRGVVRKERERGEETESEVEGHPEEELQEIGENVLISSHGAHSHEQRIPFGLSSGEVLSCEESEWEGGQGREHMRDGKRAAGIGTWRRDGP